MQFAIFESDFDEVGPNHFYAPANLVTGWLCHNSIPDSTVCPDLGLVLNFGPSSAIDFLPSLSFQCHIVTALSPDRPSYR
ncbi:hypothetical protein EVAR_10088_1 [Eumeta japonica]|uniref:Uncharacterized protein n=1 Tax=Eumeta variegata TaxID=151549 RepID=A0A4C1UCY6_EUMVA|nr:hypothetical protein EVAR_10088_1 [Eumeta japonica]